MYQKDIIKVNAIINNLLELITLSTDNTNMLFRLIYNSNHLPHQLSNIQQQFQALTSNKDREIVLKTIKHMIHKVNDHELTESVNRLLVRPPFSQEFNGDSLETFDSLIMIFNKYISNKLHEATTVDCTQKSQLIHELQQELISIAENDVANIKLEMQQDPDIKKLYEECFQLDIYSESLQAASEEKLKKFFMDQKIKFNNELKSCMMQVEKEKESYLNKNNNITQLSQKSFILSQQIEDIKFQQALLLDQKNSLNLELEIISEVDNGDADSEFAMVSEKISKIEQQFSELESKILDLNTNLIETDLNISSLDIDLNQIIQKIKLFEQKILILEKFKIDIDLKSLSFQEIKQKFNQTLITEQIVLGDNKYLSEINPIFNEIAQLSKFFSLQDERQNLKNIDAIQGFKICGNSLKSASLVELRENIIQHSILSYFTPFYEFDLYSLPKQKLFEQVNRRQSPRPSESTTALKLEDVSEENLATHNPETPLLVLPESDPAFVPPMSKDFVEIVAGDPIERRRSVEALRRYEKNIEEATNPSQVESVTHELQETLVNTGQSTLRSLGNHSNINFGTHESTMSSLGDRAVERKQQQEQAKILAELIINILKETRDIDPNLPTIEERANNMIKLSNDLPHKLGINK